MYGSMADQSRAKDMLGDVDADASKSLEEKVEASDGTEAFNLLVAAVNSADERVKGFEGELKQVLDKAEKSPMKE